MGARRRLTRQRALVALTTGRQLAGIVMSDRGGLLELADARVLDESGWKPVDGRMVVEWSRVEWVQIAGVA